MISLFLQRQNSLLDQSSLIKFIDNFFVGIDAIEELQDLQLHYVGLGNFYQNTVESLLEIVSFVFVFGVAHDCRDKTQLVTWHLLFKYLLQLSLQIFNDMLFF